MHKFLHKSAWKAGKVLFDLKIRFAIKLLWLNYTQRKIEFQLKVITIWFYLIILQNSFMFWRIKWMEKYLKYWEYEIYFFLLYLCTIFKIRCSVCIVQCKQIRSIFIHVKIKQAIWWHVPSTYIWAYLPLKQELQVTLITNHFRIFVSLSVTSLSASRQSPLLLYMVS